MAEATANDLAVCFPLCAAHHKSINTMKKKSIIGLFLSVFGLSVTTTSCEDMLTPDMDLYATDFSGRDTVNFYFGILSNVQDMIENNTILGDIRSDLVDTTSYVSDSVATLANFDKIDDADNGLLNRAAYYKVINQCNYYLAKADTLAKKNNNYYMRTEFAQVQFIRAWTYMQLVQNYGSVPFITSPVTNANTGWETNPEGGWATADNLLDKLMAAGLSQAYNYEKLYGTPNYGTLNNRAITVPHTYTIFPADVVMGDLYLLRGQSQNDFAQAANYYYTYMKKRAQDNSLVVNIGNATNARKTPNPALNRDDYTHNAGTWATSFMDQSNNLGSNTEQITLAFSSSNRIYGTVLTRLAEFYGFTPKSTSSGGSADDNAGNINVTADYRYRQLAPSKRYNGISSAQLYRFTTDANDNFEATEPTKIVYPEGLGDGRQSANVQNVRTTVGVLPFVQIHAYSGTQQQFGTSTYAFLFNYTINIYRLRQVYLRFAEAVNRAGYPRHAFAILRDGLNAKNIPAILTDSVVDGHVFPYLDAVANGCDYIGVDELRRAQNVPFLDFSDTWWDNVCGIHELGSGPSADVDTLFAYDEIVAKRMAEEEARVAAGTPVEARAQYYKNVLRSQTRGLKDEPASGQGDGSSAPADPQPALDPVIPDNIGAQINAVETLIADEMALETPFEGKRYYDLYRIARHKNADAWNFATAGYGTNWFAWTIARRAENLAPYANPLQMNNALYNKLLNIDNWYLKNPQY